MLESDDRYLNMTVSKARKAFREKTGLGHESIQLMAITHTYLQDMMNGGNIPFMALADDHVAPYSFSDFFDTV